MRISNGARHALLCAVPLRLWDISCWIMEDVTFACEGSEQCRGFNSGKEERYDQDTQEEYDSLHN